MLTRKAMFRPAIRLALGGRDTISFQAGDGDPFVNYFTRKRVIDLANGTDPYGGIVTLTGVENVRDTSAGDLFIGDDKANRIGDGFFDGGADTVRAAGGNDTVLAPSVRDVVRCSTFL